MKKNKLISIITPCYNEVENIRELVNRIRKVMSSVNYSYEHIFIDNSSSDGTVHEIKKFCSIDKKIKLIVNSRNFGHIRSPAYGMLQSSGDAVILISSDLQDPPELIPKFLKKWESGFKVVFAVKPTSDESKLIFAIRSLYYKFLKRISETSIVENATGAGLYDKSIVNIIRKIDDPYPYIRGLVCEIGFDIGIVPFNQPARKKGITKNNFYTLYDMAMLGITSHSKIPLRVMAILGFIVSLLSIITASIFFIAKVFFWHTFDLGIAPLLIGLFFFGSIQAFCIGILGEYIASIHTKSRKLPLVIEKERVNF